jgi:hypothetical protein
VELSLSWSFRYTPTLTLLTIVEIGDSVLRSTLLILLLPLSGVYIHCASVRTIQCTIVLSLLLTIGLSERRVLSFLLLFVAI